MAILNKWEIVHDADLDDGTPTMWVITVKPENRVLRNYWICLLADETYDVIGSDGQSVLKNCKTMASAKRWVTMNLL